MLGLLKFIVYFVIIVGVLKHYETKMNDDKQIMMVVLLILLLIIVVDYMFFKNTEGFAKNLKTDAEKKKKKAKTIKKKNEKIRTLNDLCPQPTGNTCAEPTKYSSMGIQSALCNQCIPDLTWNNRTGINSSQKGLGCSRPEDACIPYRVADPNNTSAYYEVSACVPIETAPRKINSCANPTQYNTYPDYIPAASCACDPACGSGYSCESTTLMNPNGPYDINGPITGREVKQCVAKTTPPMVF